MSGILGKIEEFFCDFCIKLILGNMETMFLDVNNKVSTIAADVGQTPSDWNNNIFSMIQNLAETVIVPIAGIILTFVFAYEIIQMIIDKNNLHDLDTWIFFKYFFKLTIAVYLVTNTFTIAMSFFDMAQSIVTQSAGLITSETTIDIAETLETMNDILQDKDLASLAMLVLETALLSLAMKVISICIILVLYGRMIEIFIYSSAAPIPFATLTNREWGSIGTNYIKGLVALAIQGFFIMVVVAIYAVLIQSVAAAEDFNALLLEITAYTALLVFSLFRTSSVAKSILNAH